MPELPTVEIHSLKDPSRKAIINEADYDPDQHTLWGEMSQDQGSEPEDEPQDEKQGPEAEPQATAVPEPEAEAESEPQAPRASAVPPEDQIRNSRGQVTGVLIVHPEDARRRMQITSEAFDPDEHTPWSMRGR